MMVPTISVRPSCFHLHYSPGFPCSVSRIYDERELAPGAHGSFLLPRLFAFPAEMMTGGSPDVSGCVDT